MILLIAFIIPYLPMSQPVSAPVDKPITEHKVNSVAKYISNLYQAELIIRRSA